MIYPILVSKMMCSGDKYFSIFEKHLPDLKPGSDICMYDISNENCIWHIIDRYPNCNYYISDMPQFIAVLKNARPELKLNSVEDKNKRFDITMKFDCIIMNPPYQKNLHLKILAEAIKHLKDDDSLCVNLSPVRWLQDPLAKFKKSTAFKRFEESISKHLTSVDIIKDTQANEIFNIVSLVDLAIYCCTRNNGLFNYNSICDTRYNVNIKWLNRIFEKILNENGFNELTISKYNKSLQNFVLINRMAPPSRCGKPMFDALKRYCRFFTNGKNEFNQTYDQAKKACPNISNGNIENDEAVVFNTAIEAKNCYNSMMNTNFCRFVYMMSITDIHVPQQFLPWMNKCINPRTGLKGYESEWTDDDFYKFFNITEDEQKIIEDTMAKYK